VAYLSDCYQDLLIHSAGGDRAGAIVAFRQSGLPRVQLTPYL
jgi:hypothetical protein